MCEPVRDPARIRRAMEGHAAWLEVDLDRLRRNLARIRERVGVEVMPVVKNNAYGHGLVPVTRCLYDEGVRWFLVAKHHEALAIRRRFADSRVLSMDALFGDACYEQVVRHGISQATFTIDMAHRLNDVADRLGQRVSVFVKVDTGLRRVGVHHEQAPDFIEEVASLPSVDVTGVFASFMQDPERDPVMLERFNAVRDEVARRGIPVQWSTMASTDAILHRPGAWLDMVRPAMCLYGVLPHAADQDADLDLEQVLSLKARIELVKPVREGDSVTYFGTFTAPRDLRVGTIHLGFYDAIPREMVNRLKARVGGEPVSGVGTISLNHSLLDLTDTDAQVGDVVTVIGREPGITLYDMAQASGWMVYSLMNHLSGDLPRVYLDGGEPVALLDPANAGLAAERPLS